MLNKILERLERIEMLLLSQKEIINVKELSALTGWSVSYIYKLTMAKMIPHFKPRTDAKMLYFKKSEIEAYMTSHKVKTKQDMEAEASQYLYAKRK